MTGRRKNNPGEPVTVAFCNERTRRIEQKMDGMKNEIINEINNAALKRNSMSWQARATIVAALVMAVASVVVAYIR